MPTGFSTRPAGFQVQAMYSEASNLVMMSGALYGSVAVLRTRNTYLAQPNSQHNSSIAKLPLASHLSLSPQRTRCTRGLSYSSTSYMPPARPAELFGFASHLHVVHILHFQNARSNFTSCSSENLPSRRAYILPRIFEPCTPTWVQPLHGHS